MLKEVLWEDLGLYLKELAFIFKNDAENSIYNDLLKEENQNFELTFEKEKVWLNVAGFDNVIDETKPQVNVNPGDYKSVVIFLEPKFAGIIKLTPTGTENPPPDIPNQKEKCADCQQEKDNLITITDDNNKEIKICSECKSKRDNKPSPTEQEKLKKAITKVEKLTNLNEDLKNTLQTARNKLSELEKTNSSNPGFWQPKMLIPVGIGIVVIVGLLVIFYWKKSK
ncbi:MAG: hypothetical protein MRERC_3c133 [Mycoplasmataceae bacterium RC_NB112A]|nr:MAG: hypothetical protein MRERC_3c133 [Mycoplasmataceae bacterium RC_NB112A]